HRRERERAILYHLSEGETSIPEMVKDMYKDVDKRLHPAAAMSVLGHMIELIKTGRVMTPDAQPTVRSHFELAKTAA
ncbi:MAG: MBL fold metallo-hydrolase, partial [Hyphomonas sp.]|nr:MBL fold metallo-hydrolase [Hyphomonas sp.]